MYYVLNCSSPVMRVNPTKFSDSLNSSLLQEHVIGETRKCIKRTALKTCWLEKKIAPQSLELYFCRECHQVQVEDMGFPCFSSNCGLLASCWAKADV